MPNELSIFQEKIAQTISKSQQRYISHLFNSGNNFQPSMSTADAINHVSGLLDATLTAGSEMIWSTNKIGPKWWLAQNGNFYPRSQTWANGLTGSKSFAKFNGSLMRGPGRVGNSLGILYGGYQMYEGNFLKGGENVVINGISMYNFYGAAFSFGWNADYMIEDLCN